MDQRLRALELWERRLLEIVAGGQPSGGVGEVALGIHLDMLHLVFQATMGWSNAHLWLIQANGSTWGVPEPAIRINTRPVHHTPR